MKNILFIDRDGTIIIEPLIDRQVDSLAKLEFLPGVIRALRMLQQSGFSLVMVSNQNGIGSPSFPQECFDIPHQKMLSILAGEGVIFDEIFVCPHFPEDNCTCRKPKTGLLDDFLQKTALDKARSFVIGDRETDQELAKNIGVQSISLLPCAGGFQNWDEILELLLQRKASITRKTKETDIHITVNLDGSGEANISTGIGFFDHMLEQIAKHSGINITLQCQGDLKVDEHHTVEDCGIALGECVAKALGDKRGIERYGFLLPMDESLAQVALDFSGRAFFVFDASFTRDQIGDFPTEMIPHFFRSFSDGAKATLHIQCTGENNHHIAEACFKALGRTLRQAVKRDFERMRVPSSKGSL